MSFCIWGKDRPVQWVTYITRVMEKGAAIAIALFLDMMTRISLDGIQHVVSWSDVGRHFRCKRTISTLGYRVPYMYRNATTDIPLTMAFRFGAPKHFKNCCDGHYAIQNARTLEVASSRNIETIGDLTAAWREKDAEARAAGVALPQEQFFDWVPPPKKDILDQCVVFTTKTLGQPINSGFSWSFNCVDKRYKHNWFGKFPRENVITALSCKANVIGSTAAGAERTHLCEVVAADADEPDDDADDHAVVAAEAAAEAMEMVGNDAILLGTTTFQDWKISYCKQRPGNDIYQKRAADLKKKLDCVKHTLAEPRTRPSLEERIFKHERAAKNRSAALAKVPKSLR